MKTLILLIVLFFWIYILNAQNVNIPDTAFLFTLINVGVDTNGDSLISYDEAEAVSSLDVSGIRFCDKFGCIPYGNISDLTGIEAFVNLVLLNIEGNNIDYLDLSENNDLRYLNCEINNLSTLYVSENTILQSLNCRYNQLTNLDVSGCNDLELLWCSDNQLISLNVSDCVALTDLNCFNNQLIDLDVNGCNALKELDCHENQLTSLDVSNCSVLKSLNCYGNQLTNLDISGCIGLTYLNCGIPRFARNTGNLLTSLDVSDCIALTEIFCYDNQLTTLDVSKNIALTRLDCSDNQLSSLDVSKNTALTNLIISDIPTLHEVCVWEMPFPPAGVNVERVGSPNMCFETNCDGECGFTLIDEYKQEIVSIFSNPATHWLSIDFIETAGENTSIMLFDITGKVVYLEILEYTAPSTHTINLSSLREGLYLMRISNEKYSVSEKVIKVQ
jgi:hypothetical protein